jgi:ABC-type sugar transport system ATPase subunit
MVVGFERPDVGSIHIGATDIIHLPPHRRNLGMVFQNYSLFRTALLRRISVLDRAWQKSGLPKGTSA